MSKRASGVLLHLSSLWGDYSEGAAGRAAFEWIDFLADCGFSYWQVLPFCLPDEYASPYKSFGAFSLNPFFIDLETLYGKGLITKDELDAARQNHPWYCEFSRLNEERYALLQKAADRNKDTAGMDAFFAAHPHSASFCEFMALKRANCGREWQEWTVKVPDADALRLWRFTQYECFVQWKKVRGYANSRGVKIIGDVPIYVAADSADVRENPGLYQLDKDGRPTKVAGVPPDYFCADGQLWGNPLYDWDAMAQDGYAWWRERIAFMSELFDGVRIDHFRGFESYFAIPAGEKSAKNGKWVKGPGLALVEALKEAAGDMTIIAEDLGVITDEVRKLVEDSGLPGMRVLQFAIPGAPDSPHLPHNYPANCVAYTGTHDNNTLLGYVWELDKESRDTLMSYCGYSDRENWDGCYHSIIRTMFASHADTLIMPVQDLLLFGSDTRMNKPGSSDDNWNYRITREQCASIDRKLYRQYNRLFGR